MLGGLGNLMGVLKQAKEFQGRMEEVRAELAAKRFTADAGGGVVTATVDGRCTLVDIKIDPSSAADSELLEDLVKAAVNSAAQKAQQAMQAEMSKLTSGLNLPGLQEMLGGA
jgi:DNA-binding YbaB/EbfC family protein